MTTPEISDYDANMKIIDTVLDLMVDESDFISYAQKELEKAGLFDKDSDYGGMLGESTMRLIKMFSIEDHSGWSASIQRNIFDRLANYNPLQPLTGEDDEWNEVWNGVYQNKRCSHVFKEGKDGQAYDSEGKIFRDKNGSTYQSRDSRVFITFPYNVPSKPEIVDVEE